MARVKLKFPDEKPLFSTIIPVRVGDLNYGNHVGNDSVLSLIHEARMQFMHHHGFTELNINGLGLIMADVMIAYKGESFYGDQLEIALYAEEITQFSFDLLYKITTFRNGNHLDIAHAKTGMVCFDYSNRKIADIPGVLRQIFQ